MLERSNAFSGFSVRDLAETTRFYGETLGLPVTEHDGMLTVRLGGGHGVLAYPKGAAHTPASFTILNFPVDDVEATVDELTRRGVVFERYEGTPNETDAKGVFRGGGPLIAWFKDPSGNVLSVIESTGLDEA